MDLRELSSNGRPIPQRNRGVDAAMSKQSNANALVQVRKHLATMQR
jgi:hypothetical protein